VSCQRHYRRKTTREKHTAIAQSGHWDRHGNGGGGGRTESLVDGQANEPTVTKSVDKER
jgi:hypothetical protein